MGHGRFILFYLLCGVLAAGAQLLLAPHSAVPMVGASGAISGVLAAYLMLGYWALLQVVSGVLTLGGPDMGGVAVFAHIGGFLAGILFIRVFIREEYVARRPAP